MDKALEGTPSAWVRFDKDAKAPLNREERSLEDTTLSAEDKKDYRASPPLARPIYRPAPVAPTRNRASDFDDLPGEGNNADKPSEQTLKPKNSAPPPMSQGSTSAKRENDSMENLINDVQ